MRTLLLLAIVPLASCAIVDVRLQTPALASGEPSRIGASRRVHVVTPFADDRPDPRCGMQKNGYNMQTASVVCSASPADWLAAQLVLRLQRAGFEVSTAGDPGAGAVRIEGHLRRFFVEPRIGLVTFSPEADIQVELVATSASGLHAHRDFYVKGEATSLAGTEANFQIAAERASQDLVNRLTDAVIDLLQRYPDLGATAPAS